MKLGKFLLCAATFAIATCLAGYANVCGEPMLIYCQEFDHTGNAYSSQNDTNGFGLFAQVYDNFKLSISQTIKQAYWEGAYFNPPQQGPITGWTISFYADVAGQPGNLLYSTHIAGTANETFDGNFGGFPTYTYSAVLDFSAAADFTYWLSVYPDLGFPPQWGWSSGTGGDGISYQDFFGTRSQLAADMAFALAPHEGAVPEPGTLIMLGTGVLGLSGAIRRRLF